MTRPNLLVIRSPDTDRAVKFYEAIGLSFVKHAHGKGPQHYASDCDGFVFEIYPLGKEQPSTLGVRLGFSVESVDDTVKSVEAMGASIVTPPQDSRRGRRAVVDDLDGHRVELVSQ